MAEVATETGTGSKFRFAGKQGYQTDDGTGLDMLGARFYVSALGRFLTRDPIGHAGGLNLYAYCNNNPLTSIDPKGTKGNFWIWAWSKMVGHDINVISAPFCWGNTLHNLFGLINGEGPTNNFFDASTWQTQDIKRSKIGDNIRAAISKHDWTKNRVLKGHVGTNQGF